MSAGDSMPCSRAFNSLIKHCRESKKKKDFGNVLEMFLEAGLDNQVYPVIKIKVFLSCDKDISAMRLNEKTRKDI